MRAREGRRRRTIRSGSLTTAFAIAAALISASAASAAPPGLSDGGDFYTAAPIQMLSYGSAQSVWTPERIAAAEPLGLAAGKSSVDPVHEPQLFAGGPEPLKSIELDNPASYPNRVHGKLVGTFAGFGDYACSATVVTSGSASLLTTAGHCAYDVGSRTLASNLSFAPGYGASSLPYGVWPITNLIVNKPWVKKGSLDYDFSMMRTTLSPYGSLQSIVGSRGIGFDQPRKQRLEAYGYPAKGNPSYDGTKLVRCDSGYVADPLRNGGPRSRGMHCDQQQGSSGGGWVSQRSFVVSNTSHGYPALSDSLFFGPVYGAEARSMYKANLPGWPSVGPVRCGGQVATIVGTDTGERIRGTGTEDVIATLGGNDRIEGKDGKDTICAGLGNDRVDGGGGVDRIDGGEGTDRCGKRKGGNKLSACEGSGKN